MSQLLKKVLVSFLISIAVWFGFIQEVNAQPASVHDSLKHFLIYLQDSTKDEKLIKAANDAKSLFSSVTINDSLAHKLLVVDSILIHDIKINQQIKFSFTDMLGHAIHYLQPLEESLNYARSLSNLAGL